MLEENLIPYLYRSESFEVDRQTRDYKLLSSIHRKNFDAKPELAEWIVKYTKQPEKKFHVTENSEPLFLCTFANQILDSLAETDLPSFFPYEQLTEVQQNMIHDVKPSFLKVVKINEMSLNPSQIKRLCLFGISTALPVLCTGKELALFSKLEIFFEELFHIDCWSFKYNFQKHKRNQLHIFNKEYMSHQNLIANEMLSTDLGLYAYLFNRTVKSNFVNKLDHLDDLELAIHDSKITDNVGNLYLHIGYKPNNFKRKFFQLLDHNFLAAPFYLEQYIDSSSEYKVLDVKHKSQNLIAYMLLHFASNQCESLDEINSFFNNKSEFNHHAIIQNIFSKFESSLHTHKLLPVT